MLFDGGLGSLAGRCSALGALGGQEQVLVGIPCSHGEHLVGPILLTCLYYSSKGVSCFLL